MATSSTAYDTLLYIRGKDVELACSEVDSVAVISEVLRLHGSSQTVLPDEAYLGWTNHRGESARSLNMPGYIDGGLGRGIAGTKVINSNPYNVLRGLPRADGLTILFDPESARILCAMEGAYLSALRTASVTALATNLLKGPEIECMAIIGAGVLARAHIALLIKHLPSLRQIRLYDLEEGRSAKLRQDVASIVGATGATIVTTASAEDAIRPAQLIVPVTTTTSGYICYEWLQPGSILVNVSLDDALPDVVLKADKVIVDDWNLVKSDTRRLLGRMYREGLIVGPDESHDQSRAYASNARRIDAQLGEIIIGAKTGRYTPEEIILVNPFGLSIEDLALAAHVYRVAMVRGLGVALER